MKQITEVKHTVVTTITKFEASDKSQWNTREEAEERETELNGNAFDVCNKMKQHELYLNGAADSTWLYYITSQKDLDALRWCYGINGLSSTYIAPKWICFEVKNHEVYSLTEERLLNYARTIIDILEPSK